MLNVDSNVLLEQPEPEELETSTDSSNLDKLTMKAMPFMYAHCHHYNKPYFIEHLVHRVVTYTIPKLRKQDLLYYTNKTNANLIYSFFKLNATTSRPITEEKMIRVFEFLSNTHLRYLILPFSSAHQTSKITKSSFISLPDSIKFNSERNSFETPFASYTDFSRVDKQRSTASSSSNFKHEDTQKHYSTASASSNIRSSIGVSPFGANDAIVDLDQIMRQQKTDDSISYRLFRTPKVMHCILSFCTPIVLCKFQLCSKRCYLMGGHNAVWSPYLFHFLLLMKDRTQIQLPVMEIPMGSTNQLFKHLYGQLMQYFEYHFVPESNYEAKCFSSFKFKESVFQPIMGSYNPSEKSLNSPNIATLQTTVLQSQSQDEMIENWLFLPMKQYMPYFIRTMKKFFNFETLFRNEHFINSIAIPRYLHFMKLQHLLVMEARKKNPDINLNNTSLLLIPTLEIEFIWTCHVLRYEQYKEFCLKNFGYVMEHYLKRRIDVFDFLQRLESTSQFWHSHFGSHYLDYPYIHVESDNNFLATNKFIEDINCNIKFYEVLEDLNWIKEYNHHLEEFINMKQSHREHSASTNQLNQLLRLYPLDVEKDYYHKQIEAYMQILCMASNKLDKFFSYSHSHKSPTHSNLHHLVPINWEIDSVWRCHFLNTEAYMLMSDSLLRGNIIPYCSYLAMESLEEEDRVLRGKHSLRHYHKEHLEYTKKSLKKLYSETGNTNLEGSKCILM